MKRFIALFTLLALLSAAPVMASDDFVIQADSVESMNATMDKVKIMPPEQQSRFVALSLAVIDMIISEQESKGTFDEAEMDAAVRKMMHGKTMNELEAYIKERTGKSAADYQNVATPELSPAELRGNYRVLYIFNGEDHAELLQKQAKAVNDNKAGFDTREFYIQIVTSEHPLIETYNVSGDDFTVILIGKDGEEKQRWNDPVAAATIFEIVDAMPMRKREMADEE